VAKNPNAANKEKTIASQKNREKTRDVKKLL